MYQMFLRAVKGVIGVYRVEKAVKPVGPKLGLSPTLLNSQPPSTVATYNDAP